MRMLVLTVYSHNLVVFVGPRGIVDEFLEVVLAICKV